MTERELFASVHMSFHPPTHPNSPVVPTHHTKLDSGHILDSLYQTKSSNGTEEVCVLCCAAFPEC